jgi:hypothetical protein
MNAWLIQMLVSVKLPAVVAHRTDKRYPTSVVSERAKRCLMRMSCRRHGSASPIPWTRVGRRGSDE